LNDLSDPSPIEDDIMILIITRQGITDDIFRIKIQKSVHATVRNIKGILNSKILHLEEDDIKLI